jgi:heat-inducible transcriptional repressor
MTPAAGGRGPSAPSPDISDRSRRVLSLLVREYIEHGEPVSSLWLASHAGLQVSSATVRNVLARLEELGLVHQPHTSAGRVPTDLGYRVYVDMLLEAKRSQKQMQPDVEARMRLAGSVEDALSTASHELSRTLKCVSFALAPASEGLTMRRVDFVSLDGRRVLAVLVSTDGHVVHKVLEVPDPVPPTELTQAANYLNAEFAGQPLSAIRESLTARLQEDRVLYDRLMARALTLVSGTLEDVSPEPQLFVHGMSSLLQEGGPEEGALPIAALRAVVAMIEEKHRLVMLLDEYVGGPGLTVVIGGEHSSPALRPFSLVASTAGDEGRVTTVGVLGPTRMRYSRTIAAVESAARLVGRRMTDSHG